MSEPIDYHVFLKWIKERIGDFREKDGKIRINSLFTEDRKLHLYCKPSIGYYKCMKSGIKGTLVDLVVKVEKCSYDEAVDILDGNQDLRYLEARLERYFQDEKSILPELKPNQLLFPPNTFRITNLSTTNHFRVHAENYLANRKLPVNGLMVCVGGEYANRIIIPYYDKKGELVYWNGRDLGGSTLRYRGPEKLFGAKKEEVIWMQFYPQAGTKVYLVEGEFDAMSLNECGLHGVAFGGKDISEKQLQEIKSYFPVLAFDTDKAGKEALVKVGAGLLANGFSKVRYVRPPEQFKDWNQMLVETDAKLVKAYIEREERELELSLLNSNEISGY